MKTAIVSQYLICLTLLASGSVAGTNGTILWYLEQEAGVEPYEVRYLVSRDYLRLDEGNEESGYVLLDRNSKQIYNVVPEDNSILRINGSGELPRPPAELSVKVLESVDQKAPKIGGRFPLLLELKAGSSLCATAMVAPDYLSDAGLAMRQFSVALSVQQLDFLDRYPMEYRTPCFLARSIYASDFHTARGLLLAEWDSEGRRRELVRVEADAALDEGLFELPDGFKIYTAEDVE